MMATVSTIPNGTFTVTSPSGEHRTFRVKTWQKKEELTRSIELLTGPDNTEAYKGFGFVKDDGRIFVWTKCRGGQFDKLARMVEDLYSPASRFRVRGMRVEEARCCLRCNRLLSTPESIERGYGPECYDKAMM